MAELQAEARAGLWNLFLRDRRWGAGLTNLEYAPLAELSAQASPAATAAASRGDTLTAPAN